MSKRLPPPLDVMHLTFEGALPPVARDADPVTSHRGHDRVAPKRGTRAAQVLALLKAHPAGLTAQEVELFLQYRDLATGKLVTGWWKRLSDLKAAGLVRGTGDERDGGEVYVAVGGA